ncbi:cytochrome c family protein [Pseudothauera nasutitermitis]|uniref:Cytochrome c family protein n=1 Tax=Pseudothauera nasutitermitis TaxID=2565930 RepID=A0A4S4AQ03_9RHOO|nr:cytochrome c family protein [Pseudothauera nasutitermitis]THF61805.1 cytochrome c family protein [Pseudothauera nasutitermitis]
MNAARAVRAVLPWGAALALLAAAAEGAAQAPAAGERGYRQYCKPCHALGPGAENRAGPALNAVAGQAAGAVPGYAYSDALKASGIVWNEAEFVAYLLAPTQRVPGTKKLLAGVRNEQTLTAIYRYLEAQRSTAGN